MSLSAIPDVVSGIRNAFWKHKTLSLNWRVSQIKAVQAMITDNLREWEAALKADLGVNDFFTQVELDSTLLECKEALRHLASWTKPIDVATPLLMFPSQSKIRPEPYGAVLIIAPWNYPVSLALTPLVSAIAAGNTVVIKPSEVSVNVAATFGKLFHKYMDPECIQLVLGGVAETSVLLKQKWDFITYTGNGSVARVVMRAAAENLTPVLLELGGKCPVIVADDADIPAAAKRIAWAKWSLNNGQTCVTADYILCTAKAKAALVPALKAALADFYSATPKSSADVSRLITVRHTERVAALIRNDPTIEILVGGEVDAANRYIAPTIVSATAASKCMQEEIFGPLLPVVEVGSVSEAIAFVNARDKPLALYVFSRSKETQALVLDQTHSGGSCVNDVAMHLGNLNLPFGGVGPSGMGAYHGKHGFDAFSHRKAVLIKQGSDPSLRFPPYTPSKISMLKRLRGVDLEFLKQPLLEGVPVVIGALAFRAML